MDQNATILIAEDDNGHASLIQKNLERAGILNPFLHLKDGQETLDFLFQARDRCRREGGRSYLLILDIRMPKMDGFEVLERIKADPDLARVPVIVVTTTDDPVDKAKCRALGCEDYITKSIDYEAFTAAIRRLGFFLKALDVPSLGSPDQPGDPP